MRLLIIDFYDSFTYNLAHYFRNLDCEVVVLRENNLDLDSLLSFDGIVLSPGPGLPKEKKNLFEVLNICKGKVPVLGICLGMQGISEFLGARLENQLEVKHGVSTQVIQHKPSLLFENLPQEFQAGLYHSWKVVDLSQDFLIAESEEGVAMGLEVLENYQFGVQFHPESILTEKGFVILNNFINFCLSLK